MLLRPVQGRVTRQSRRRSDDLICLAQHKPDRVFRSVAECCFTLSPVGRRSDHRDASVRYACRSGGMFLGRSKADVYNNVYKKRWIISFSSYNSIGY